MTNSLLAVGDWSALVIKKDEDATLHVKIEWVLKEAFIVSQIFNASLNLVGHVHGVQAIWRELDLYVVRFEHFLCDSFEHVRRERRREHLPDNITRQKSLEFI